MKSPNFKSINKAVSKSQALNLKILFFILVFIIGLIISIAVPFRPNYSESEKRQLAKFPSFSLETLGSGKYFRSVDTWFADTFPGRDFLISFKSEVQNLYGFHPTQIHGKVEEGDAIPENVVVENNSDAQSSNTASNTTSGSGDTNSGSKKEDSTNKEAAVDTDTDIENEKDTPVDLNTQTLGALLLAGDSAFEYYNFNKNVSTNYIKNINTAAEKLKGISTVYDMIIPTSIDIKLPKSVRKNLNSSDQKKAIDFMYTSMSDNVKTVAVFDSMKKHSNEYIYFRTDHHWTALGAYYAYDQFAKAKGIAAVPISGYKTLEFPGFIGSFYSESGKKPELKKHPDTVKAYVPPVNSNMYYVETTGEKVDWPVVSDVTGWNPNSLYSTFIGGDHPYTLINNTGLNDNSSCIVVKESYGNAFIPFLVSHYQTIHVVDYRYWNQNLIEFAKKNNVKDIIFLNNISMTRSKALVNKLSGVIN